MTEQGRGLGALPPPEEMRVNDAESEEYLSRFFSHMKRKYVPSSVDNRYYGEDYIFLLLLSFHLLLSLQSLPLRTSCLVAPVLLLLLLVFMRPAC